MEAFAPHAASGVRPGCPRTWRDSRHSAPGTEGRGARGSRGGIDTSQREVDKRASIPPGQGSFSPGWYHRTMRFSPVSQSVLHATRRGAWLLIAALVLTGSTLNNRDPLDRIRRLTRTSEFDFARWTLGALGVKIEQSSLGYAGYLPDEARQQIVREYIDLTRIAGEFEARQVELTADPAIPQPSLEAESNQLEIRRIRERLAILQPQAETVLQEQEAVILEDMGLEIAGLPLPPVSFRFSRLPLSIVVSPRNIIRQDASVQLDPGLTLERQIALENHMEDTLGVSALVVPLGGIGTYPTMVQESTSLAWLAGGIAHEWAHNYLFFRPLGFLYETNFDSSPEVRTMNETAASLFGKAVSLALLERYFPDLGPAPPSSAPTAPPDEPPAFDFRAEMHATRLNVDALLAQGQVEEAEAYMEARRQVFWDAGYHIRRLNQAYFAFYGAYSDEPGGAAGADPVGEAVRLFWERSPSPASFLKRIGWMRTYQDLLRALER